MGKFIIIEGLDGCGKSTQTKLLEEYFEKNSINFKKIKLPDYDSKSSTLVKTGLRLISLIGAKIIITEH